MEVCKQSYYYYIRLISIGAMLNSSEPSIFKIHLVPPQVVLEKVFEDIKAMQKDNLNDMPTESKDDKN